MKRIFYLTVLSLFFSQLLHADYFKHIGLSDGLNQFSVISIHQDVLGRMWFGTQEGISVYNGNDITSYRAYTNSHLQQPERILIGNSIYSILGNREGNIFIIADRTLLKYDIRRETFHQLTSTYAMALASYQGDIWCVSSDSIYLYNEATEQLKFIMKTGTKLINSLTVTADKFYIGTIDGLYVTHRIRKDIQKIIPDVDVYRVFESSTGEMWVGTRMEGLFRISPEGHIAKVPYAPGLPHGINSHQIRDFIEDNQHNIWFGTFDGLHKYNPQTGKYTDLRLGKNRGGLEHSSIFALYKDQQGSIWIGSYFGGVNYFNPEYDIFSRYNYANLSAHTPPYFSYISSITEDNESNLWIGTDGGGISCMNREDGTFRYFTAGKGNALPHNNVKSICYDPKRNYLYIGTYIGGLSRYDIRKEQFHNYLSNSPGNPLKAPGNIVYTVQFRHDRLYVSARNGFFQMNPDTNEFQMLYNGICQFFDVDDEEHIWLDAEKSVIGIDPDTRKKTHVIPLQTYGCNFEITKIKATKSGVYIATLGSGVFYYDKTTEKVTRYSAENGQLLSDYCYNLAETNQGNILITCNEGITLFSPVQQDFRSISISSGFPGSSIVNGCGMFIALDNEIFVGDVAGITTFQENDLKIPVGKLKFYLSHLSVNNQRIYPGDATHILDQSLPFVKNLRLHYNQNNLIFNFALSNYVSLLQNNWYEYKLEGFDHEWIPTRQMSIYYTNLDPGKYVLRIRTKGDMPGSRVEEISQQITISRPWYNTFWAWFLYITAASLCTFYFVRSRIVKRRLAFSLEKERFEKQQIEQMNHAKLLFFTNVSHEFRTPLTLIITHIDMLLQNMSMAPTLYSHIVTIDKHARRMRNLVTELLDFRKFDQNHFILKIAEQNVVDFVREIYVSFLEYARQRDITYRFNFSTHQINLFFDARQMEKVFFNLLSNAFKYTSKGGTIEINIIEDKEACIEVVDSGVGMTTKDSLHVFDRFYQANNEPKNKDATPGAGIGLALTKTIVEKHHGSISVASEMGRGSIFSVHIPRGKEHFLADGQVRFIQEEERTELITGSMPSSVELEEITLGISDEPEQPVSADTPSYTLLIVEDNEDLLKMLQQLFAPFYQISIARNGKQGLELAISEKPDLIVSDVMMPEMTGTEMCIQIKNNIDTCHIPIVLLTALNTIEQNIEGLNRGADDYITKPFNARMLLARCNNLVRNRLLVQQQFTQKPISEIDLTTINPLDKDLLKQAVAIIDEHIDDPEFDIPQLCKELAMGRTLLYAKFKALTGMTPNNFLLNHKLKRAAMLLRTHPEMQVSEIAYALGFGSPIYFSRCFKIQFHTTPQNYRRENSTKE